MTAGNAANEPSPARESLRRRLRGPALVLLGLVTIDVGLRATADVWDRHSPDDYAERVNGCLAEPRDFVFVGGSPVSEGLDPAVVRGIRWRGERLANGYAVGLPGGTTTDFYFAITRACPTPPKLLVYGITASDMNDRRNEPHGPHSLMGVADVADLADTRPDAAEWAVRHFVRGKVGSAWAAYHYRHGIRMAAAMAADEWLPGCCPEETREARELREYADKLRAGTGYAPAKGFEFRRYDEVKANHYSQPPFNFLDNYRIGSHLKYLNRLIEWCAANGTSLVLLDMPVTADLEAQYPAVVAEYRERLREVERDRGVTVVRADRDTVGLTDAEFADIIHLNRVGAAKLSGWLRDRLADRPPGVGGSDGPGNTPLPLTLNATPLDHGSDPDTADRHAGGPRP